MTPRQYAVDESRGVLEVDWPLFGELSRALALKVSREFDPQIVLGIANAGAIPPAVLPGLFDPFRARADRTGRGSGLGLGLYIVRQIARAHGGDVAVRSDPADGTAFTATLGRRPGA